MKAPMHANVQKQKEKTGLAPFAMQKVKPKNFFFRELKRQMLNGIIRQLVERLMVSHQSNSTTSWILGNVGHGATLEANQGNPLASQGRSIRVAIW